MNAFSAAVGPSAVPHSAPSGLPPFRILVLPGDGIGREVIPAAVAVLQATGLRFEFVPGQAGWACFERHGTSLPDETLGAARAADAILFGAVASPSHPVPGYRSPIVALRRELDLYANIRPVATDHRPPTTDHQSLALSVVGGQSPTLPLDQLGNRRGEGSVVDLVVVRENTEGLYAGRERVEHDGDTAIAERVITRWASERIARAAFELARSRATTDHRPPTTDHEASTSGSRSSVVGRRSSKVTIVHKANVLRETCGLFRAAALRVAAEYPDVETDELLVDTAALQLVQRPERFDVIVTTNLFGDILSDVASYWGGGLGLAPSANIGDRQALFEPVHGSAPDIAGQGIANPLAAIGCAALLLEYLGSPTTDHRPPTTDHPDLYGGSSVSAPVAPTDSGHTGAALQNRCREWADRIRAAIRETLAAGICTPDLGGSARTEDVTNTIIASIIDRS
jgi:homoisocitrate dehydrogenase